MYHYIQYKNNAPITHVIKVAPRRPLQQKHYSKPSSVCRSSMADVNHHNNIRSYENSPEQRDQVVVIMVPLAAQGHLNQLLQLSRLISSYNIPVHYVGSVTHIRQAKQRATRAWNPSSAVYFHDFPLPPFLTPPPNPHAQHKFPTHLQPAWEASACHLREPVGKLIQALAKKYRRVVVIHDSLMGSTVQEVASLPNAESYVFHTVSAFAINWYYCEASGKKRASEEFDCSLPLEGCFTAEFIKFIESQEQHRRFSSGNIYNTARVIEGKYMDAIEKLRVDNAAKHWAIGPFNPVRLSSSPKAHHCLEWLDGQEPNSVIYVSFGTTTAMSDDQVNELAVGLEDSGVKFIWVLRDADKGDVFSGEVRSAELPCGYEERVKGSGQGLIIRDWAPQLEILGHVATGGFMSHCGWNSCMESITMGVPIVAWPMHSDQPRNSVLVTHVLGIGVVVSDDLSESRGAVVARDIEEAVRMVMESKEGAEMRRKAMELACDVRQSMEDGGSSKRELDSFIKYITRC